jgi:transposase
VFIGGECLARGAERRHLKEALGMSDEDILRQMAAAGLDPKVRQSGSEPAGTGRITKQGSPQARWVLSAEYQPLPMCDRPTLVLAAES